MNYVQLWNELVALKEPTLRQLKSTAPQWSLLFPPNLHFLGSNLIVMGPHGDNSNLGLKATEVTLIVAPEIYDTVKIPAGIKFKKLEPCSILGHSLDLSAQAFLDSIKRDGVKPGLSTMSNLDGKVNEWEISYGRALALNFKPTTGEHESPSDSKLILIRYFFGMPYQGRLPATLTSIPTSS